MNSQDGTLTGFGAIGFAGLGVMGRPMAENLLAAGADLVVWNRSPEAPRALAGAGAAVAANLADLADRADVIITMLADDAAVRAVVGEGLLPTARPGSLIVDMSTVSPALSRELAASAAARGVAMMDAPVSGGDVGARNGTLSIMVGGGAADLERARPWRLRLWARAWCCAGRPARGRSSRRATRCWWRSRSQG